MQLLHAFHHFCMTFTPNPQTISDGKAWKRRSTNALLVPETSEPAGNLDGFALLVLCQKEDRARYWTHDSSSLKN